MDRRQQVFIRLKPKVKAFGFNKKELQGVADQIADNLTSADDASEEDVNAEIDERIEAVLPFLQLGQSYANRLSDEVRKKNDGDDPDGDEPNSNHKGAKPNSANNGNDKNKAPEWAASLLKTVEVLTGEISALKGDKITSTRKRKLEDLLKDAGSYGKRTLKNFERMKFETDEEFEDFISEVEEDLKTYKQEMADKGLDSLGNPPAPGTKKTDGDKVEPFSEKEIEEMVKNL